MTQRRKAIPFSKLSEGDTFYFVEPRAGDGGLTYQYVKVDETTAALIVLRINAESPPVGNFSLGRRISVSPGTHVVKVD